MVDVIVSGFDGDEDNILHIERHHFTPDEVEESLSGTTRSGGRVRSCTLLWARPLTAAGRLLYSADNRAVSFGL